MQQDPIDNEIKAEDNSLKDIWNDCRKIFLEGIEQIEDLKGDSGNGR